MPSKPIRPHPVNTRLLNLRLGHPGEQVRRVMAEDPNKARRLLGSLDIKLLPPSAVTALILTLLRQQDLKVRYRAGKAACV